MWTTGMAGNSREHNQAGLMIVGPQCATHTIVLAHGAGAGMTLALVLMASIREETDLADLPAAARGTGLVLILAASLSLAFMGFSGLGAGA